MATDSKVPGGPVPTEDKVLETGASMIQDFQPTKQLCAHLNAFHTYADEPGRFVETNHYCAHLTEGISCHISPHLISSLLHVYIGT